MAQLKAAAGDAQRRDDGYVSFGDLELGERIGVRAFASVYAATSLSTRRKYAVKVVALRGGGRNAAKDAALLRAEGRMLRTLHHPSVISCYDVVDDPGERSSIVLELCEGGELLERIVESANHHFSEAGARQAARTLLSAVAHIHDHAICHCDLKPENLLLKSKSTDYDCKGTDEYMAPEVLALERTKGAPRYGLKADAWACGAIVHALLFGYLPWPTSDRKTMVDAILAPEALEFSSDERTKVSAEALHLVAGLLDRDPARRLGARDALATAWFDLDAAPLKARRLSLGEITFEVEAASSRGSEDVGPAARSPPKTALVGRSELQSFRDSRRASDAAPPPRVRRVVQRRVSLRQQVLGAAARASSRPLDAASSTSSTNSARRKVSFRDGGGDRRGGGSARQRRRRRRRRGRRRPRGPRLLGARGRRRRSAPRRPRRGPGRGGGSATVIVPWLGHLQTGGPAPKLHLDMSGIKPSPPSSPADRPPPDHRRLWRKGGGGSTPPGS
ncbi:calmodulin-dependent protein kinase [Aureococcus anophagefferens]|nr:calmodulin-dependent protein kinase [Aureococcus anophagefferens]